MEQLEVFKRADSELTDASVAINCALQILESTELVDECTELWSLYRNLTKFQSLFEFKCGLGLFQYVKKHDLS